MSTIVTSNNSAIFRQLGAPGFRRLGFDHVVVQDGDEALERVRDLKPRLVILDVEMPGRSGFEVCRTIKDDPELADSRVVLVIEQALTQEVIAACGRSRCDEILSTPAGHEALFHKISRLLAVPHRGYRRIAVNLSAELRAGKKRAPAEVLDLSPEGARLATTQSLGRATALVLELRRAPGAPLVLDARAVWEDAGDGEYRCGLQFQGVDRATRTALQDLSLWEIVDRDGAAVAVLQGEFREHTRFDRLAARLAGEVEFDLRGVSYMNSAGVRQWVNFLRSLDRVTDYRLVRCSVPFVTQASMVPEVVGRGRLESGFAPYLCEDCDLEEQRLFQTSELQGWPPTPMEFPCSRCRGTLVFDDIAQRYFAFVADDLAGGSTPSEPE